MAAKQKNHEEGIGQAKATESQSGAKGGWRGEAEAIRAIEHGRNIPRIKSEFS
jgi:hypothetical protein